METGGTPAGRVLALLERVQERPGMTAPVLADELGVSERTVRRYVATLVELGIPVEADRGRYGGHRLRPGFRMPPLMLSTDEAVAVTLALAMGGESGASRSALAKLQRVLPRSVAERVADVVTTLASDDRDPATAPADPGVLAALATGVVAEHTCRVRHRNDRGVLTVRDVNPYGAAVVWGAIYLHGWCHLRQARRTFRVDRIDRVDVLSRDFRRPRGLDVRAAVERSIALARPEWSVSLLLGGPVEEVSGYFPRSLAVCEDAGDGRTRVRSSTSNPDYFVLRISDHPFAMTVEEPAELRSAFARAAERMAAAAQPQERSTSTP